MVVNNAFILNGILDTTFSERPIPELEANEVLVEVKKTGICGSDVHSYAEGRLGDNVVTQPFVLGHESSGVIARGKYPVEMGEQVKNVNVGDRVAMQPGVTCRICHECKSGKYEVCGDIIFPSAHPVDGTLQRYYKFPVDSIYKLPDHLTLEDGAVLEPLSVAVHAVSSIGSLHAGQNVVVFGAGPVGLACMAVARALGALRVIAVDILPSRLEFAKGYAASDTYLTPPLEKDESKIEYSRRVAKIMKDTLGFEERGSTGIDLVVDASGAETCIQIGILVGKVGGTFVQVGFGPPNVQVPITTLLTKELTMKGSYCYGPGDYPLALGLASSGKVDLKPLVTHRFEDAAIAFETTRAGKGKDGTGKMRDAIKVIISGPDVDPVVP